MLACPVSLSLRQSGNKIDGVNIFGTVSGGASTTKFLICHALIAIVDIISNNNKLFAAALYL